LQLTADFGFDRAAERLPYLSSLGISTIYLSPILEAAAGSQHGYDVIDHESVSAQLGGREAFERLARAAHEAGMAVMVDIVPNHMSIADPRNRWWWDVLENGPSARSAHVFDVDWNATEQRLKNVVLLPVLGDRRGQLLARGEISVLRCGSRFEVRYAEHRFPVAPRSVAFLLERAEQRHRSDRLAFFVDAFAELPPPILLDDVSIARRHRDRVVLAGLLEELFARDAEVAAAVDVTVAALTTDVPALDEFLGMQNYRLAFWRAAERDLDYRRFFDINSLVGLRVEDPRVFAATHALIAELVREGHIDALRVDHVDGLADPAAYLHALRALMGDIPVYVEKILGVDETLRAWPVAGTTGYEFLDDVTALFVDPRAEAVLSALASELGGEQRGFAEIAHEARVQVLAESLDSDVRRLCSVLARVCDRYPEARDFTRHELDATLSALIAAFPVYRSYVVPTSTEVAAEDAAIVVAAVEQARRAPHVEPVMLDFIADLLRLRRRGPGESEFVRRFQQLTPPAMAKGVEDTAFYRDARLLALDEVGGDPTRFSLALDAFHARNRAALERWPLRMLTTSTHDTKRSDDARARLVGISTRPALFVALARAFFTDVEKYRHEETPDGRTLLIFLQVLVATWPIDRERCVAHLLKAVREAKLRTSWARPDARYEEAVTRFVGEVLADDSVTARIAAFVSSGRVGSRAVSLAWTLLKTTCPGIPDFYQGSEAWRFDLVDPDNRAPVDWARLATLVEAPRPTLEADETGVNKAYIVRRALHHRRRHAMCFDPGSAYTELALRGRGRQACVAFARIAPSGETSVVVVPRWAEELESWAASTTIALPKGRFVDVLADDPTRFEGEVTMAQLLCHLPIALLHAEAA
jgi:(1->4)-alpha-D-glucan 1-alpha-D-glucosylmutase